MCLFLVRLVPPSSERLVRSHEQASLSLPISSTLTAKESTQWQWPSLIAVNTPSFFSCFSDAIEHPSPVADIFIL